MSVVPDDLRTLSCEAVLYVYPLALMEVERLQALNPRVGSNPDVGATPDRMR
ncbi:hypothetical protein [Mycobacterium lacus]|uniref:Uncharacterized protein n=1 Tax=Mycobacterium lacus TaxID=169765 RepID=A0A7I7NL19_9MYCO|nr:hypothetical protein [Mycobacterium lacus]MCV7125045.1 hypothetical protein [Mycobacterium lacus]BBX96391.1 hypothetical protein MLAC_16850 [Mycobacterium lacus]